MSSPRDGEHYTGQFRISTYLAASSVSRLLATPEQVREVIEGLRGLEVEHIFLELYRGGHTAEESVLVRARDMIQEAGIRVGGALTTTWRDGFGAPALPQPDEQGNVFCYSDPKTAEDIARVCELAGKLFDELILDDYFFTNCECDACRAAKGDLPWSVFRNKLLADFAAKAILAPAHRANPDCQVIIKYPQWYDRFQEFGYDADAQTKQFDAIWVGTETRNPYSNDKLSFTPQSQSWSVYGWLHDLAGPKTLGGWFDPYNCDVPSYVEQGYQNALIGTPEILLFNYDSLQHRQCVDLVAGLKEDLPRIRGWSAALRGAKPTGLACYKPPNSTARSEPFVYDYITMLGIPTTMHATFPENASVIFLPAQALTDRDVLDKVRRHIASGRSVLATAEFLLRLDAPEVLDELFGLTPRASLEEGPAYTRRIRMGDEHYRMRRYMHVTGALEATDAEVLVSWGISQKQAPYFTRKQHGEGAAMMLDTYTVSLGHRAGVNIDRPVRIPDLAQPVLDCIRRTVSEPLGLDIRCPGRVGVYCFEGGPLGICNYRNDPAEVEVKVAQGSPLGDLDRLIPEPDSGVTIEARGRGTVKLQLPPRSRILFAAQGSE